MDLLIGGIAGITARSITSPLELLKLQKQNNYLKNNSLRHVIKNEGFRNLWKGNMTNCVRIFPQYSINFALFENNKIILNGLIPNKDALNFTSAAISGVISLCAVYPLETARTHLSLQTNKNKYKGLVNVLMKLKTNQLYAGLKMSILGFGPWNAINFMSYNKYKILFKDYEYNPHIYKLLCGGFAGSTAITVTYPTDLIRKRLQMQSFSPIVPRYSGILDCLVKIIKQEGIIGLYRGLSISYLKTFPTLAIQFWTYDTLQEYAK
jgi:solute carrier family 25 (mitochondrial phosphate transporter), member 23/24/25/41